MTNTPTLAVVTLIVGLLVAPAWAQNSTPQLTKIQGFLSDKSGGMPVPATGTFSMTFDLYDSDAGGLLVASAGPLAVDVTEGLYEVGLPFSVANFDGTDRYIEITVGGETLSPRIRVVSAPFAYVAETLDGFEGADLEESAEIQDVATTHQSDVADLQGQIDNLVATGGNTLDEAYDAGRIIDADSGPVEIRGQGGLTTEGEAIVKETLTIELTSHSGYQGREAFWMNASSDNQSVGLGINVPRMTIWSTSEPGFAEVALGPLQIDIRDYANMAGRNAINIQASDQWDSAIISLNKPKLSIWSNSEDKNARVQVGELQITGGFSAADVAFIAINQPKLRIYSDSEQRDARVQLGVLEITGGADLAEPFEIVDDEVVPKGSLLVIDESSPGLLKVSDQPYDTKVAGIVSGAGGINPGLTLGQEGVAHGSMNVAMAGRVYALATASNGAIRPGDLLTTSHTSGHAMTVTDMSRAPGTIIGKAMSALDEGEGLVLVLVGLQ